MHYIHFFCFNITLYINKYNLQYPFNDFLLFCFLILNFISNQISSTEISNILKFEKIFLHSTYLKIGHIFFPGFHKDILVGRNNKK